MYRNIMKIPDPHSSVTIFSVPYQTTQISGNKLVKEFSNNF